MADLPSHEFGIPDPHEQIATAPPDGASLASRMIEGISGVFTKRRLLAIGATLLLTEGGVVPASAASSEGSAHGSADKTATSPYALSGQTAPDGVVTVYAWPDAASRIQHPTQDVASIALVNMQANATGDYSFNLGPGLSKLPSGYEDPDTDETLLEFTINGQEYFAESNDLQDPGIAAKLQSLGRPDQSPASASKGSSAAPQADSPYSRCYSGPAGSPYDNQPWKPGTIDYMVPAHYTNVYAIGTLPIKIGQESKSVDGMGVGFELTGGTGWSVNGSEDVAWTKDQGWTSVITGRVADYNGVDNQHYARSCWDFVDNKQYHWHERMILPLRLNAPDIKRVKTTEPTGNEYCAPRYAGSTYTEDSGSNQSFSAGLDLGPISVGVHTSFSKVTKLEIGPAKAKAQICGKDRDVFDSNYLVAFPPLTGTCPPGVATKPDAKPNC